SRSLITPSPWSGLRTHYTLMTDESRMVTRTLWSIVGSRQRLQKVGDFRVDLCRIGNCPGDFFPEQLSITTAKPVRGDLDRTFAHLQHFADLLVGFLQ